MSGNQPDIHNIEAILFDMNGTLRMREAHEPTQQAALARMHQLLEMQVAPDSFWHELRQRQKAYGRWAQERLSQLPEAEIWTKWLLPDHPVEKVKPIAADLMYTWGKTRGRHIPRPGAEQTLQELLHRGYRLGVISNSMSTLDIPEFLNKCGWEEIFEVVILSSVTRIRKPSPEPFLQAAQLLQVTPDRCAYVGNRIAKDLVGSKRAGYALGLLLESPDSPHPEDAGLQENVDVVVHSLVELLTVFHDKRDI